MNIDNYLNQLNLEIKSRNSHSINVRCPICGDSHTNKYKARGFILLDKEVPIYHCHNECGAMSFRSFLKQVNPTVETQYTRDLKDIYIKSKTKENYDALKTPIQQTKPILKENKTNNFKKFNKVYYKYNIEGEDTEIIYDLKELNEESLIYLLSRGFTREDVKDYKFCEETQDIVIPYWINQKENLIYGFQTRNIHQKKFHLRFFNNAHKVSNLEYVLSLPQDSEVYVIESEFDRISTGIKNSISSLGSSLSKEVYDYLNKKYKLIFCYDADEAGNRAIMKYSKKGHKVLIHEQGMYQFKDFNKLLELGQTKEDIQKYIYKNIKTPSVARIELMKLGIR